MFFVELFQFIYKLVYVFRYIVSLNMSSPVDEEQFFIFRACSFIESFFGHIKKMKDYLKLCLEGQPTIPARMEMLAKHRKELLAKINELNENLAYLDYKNEFYQNVLDGKIPYTSDLIRTDD